MITRISTTGVSPRRSASAARASRVSFPYSPAGVTTRFITAIESSVRDAPAA